MAGGLLTFPCTWLCGYSCYGMGQGDVQTQWDKIDTADLPYLYKTLKLKQCSWMVLVEDSIIPTPTVNLTSQIAPPHTTMIYSPSRGCNPWTLYSSSGPCLPLSCPLQHFPQHLPVSHSLDGIISHDKSINLPILSERRPWQLSINRRDCFFFFLFNLHRQTLESCCQHNRSILAGLALPGSATPRPVPSL